MFNMSSPEMLAFAVIALMLFGKRLPEVARNFGGAYQQLRKNLNEFQREFRAMEYTDPKPRPKVAEPDRGLEATAPKFTPPPSLRSPSNSDPTSGSPGDSL